MDNLQEKITAKLAPRSNITGPVSMLVVSGVQLFLLLIALLFYKNVMIASLVLLLVNLITYIVFKDMVDSDHTNILQRVFKLSAALTMATLLSWPFVVLAGGITSRGGTAGAIRSVAAVMAFLGSSCICVKVKI